MKILLCDRKIADHNIFAFILLAIIIHINKIINIVLLIFNPCRRVYVGT